MMMGNGNMMMGEASSDGIEWEDTMSMMSANSNTQNIQWKITDQNTGKSNGDIDWKFKVGDKVKIKITNDKTSMHPMQHPIHFHGQRFLILTSNGVKNTDLVWKDTVLIPSGVTTEILVDMGNPGTWMAHCHIAEHLQDGMMFQYKVE
jgi:FtsP/CotA-like multicopper oxidase with cupredoxin domain